MFWLPLGQASFTGNLLIILKFGGTKSKVDETETKLVGWAAGTPAITIFWHFSLNTLQRKAFCQPLASMNIQKYWGCTLRIGVAKFDIGGATATSKLYEVSPLTFIVNILPVNVNGIAYHS